MVNIETFEIFSCAGKGRGIRSTQHIKAGEEVLSEKPIVYTLMNGKFRGERCDYCFAEPKELLKCSKCKFVSYCGKKCQLGDWAIHKRECKCLIKVAPRQPPDICRLVSRLLFKYYWEKDSAATIDRGDIENLASNREFITNSRKEAFFTFGAVLYEYLKDCPLKIEDADIYGLLCRISCNSFTITNAELNSLGTGVYKTASFLNHSCDPNCIALFNGPDISIRSIKDIAEGEELLMAYVSLLAPSDVRQAQLKEGYMFDCTCDVCSGKQFNDFLMRSIKCEVPSCSCYLSLIDSTVSFMDKSCSCDKHCTISNDLLKIATTCVDELDAFYNEIKIVPTVDQQKKLEKMISKGEKLLCPSHVSLLHCYEVAMDGCLEQELWHKALRFSKKLEKSCLLYLSKYHPSIGLHYFKQGKLELQVNNLREGIDCLQKAQRVLTISHGAHHELVQMLSESIAQVSQELYEQENYETIERIYNE